MKYNTFLLNGMLLALLVVVSITTQWQSKSIYDGMAKPALVMKLQQKSILSAPPSSELH